MCAMPNLWRSFNVYLTLHCLFEVLSVQNGKEQMCAMQNFWRSFTVYLTLHCLFEVMSVRNGNGADVRDAKFVDPLLYI